MLCIMGVCVLFNILVGCRLYEIKELMSNKKGYCCYKRNLTKDEGSLDCYNFYIGGYFANIRSLIEAWVKRIGRFIYMGTLGN